MSDCFLGLRPDRPSPLSTLIHSPDLTTKRSPSLLPRVKRFSEDDSINKAKRKKESEPEVEEEEDKQGNQEGVGKRIQPELIKRSSSSLSSQSFKEPLDSKVRRLKGSYECVCWGEHVMSCSKMSRCTVFRPNPL